MPAERKRSYDFLLRSKKVSDWYEYTESGSELTAKNVLRRLGAFLAETKLTPEELLAKDPEDIFKLMMRYIKRDDWKGTYKKDVVRGIKSFLTYHQVKLPRRLKIEFADTPSERPEPVTPEILTRIMDKANTTKVKSAIILMAHSGIRPQVMGKAKGEDGLRLKDLVEMKVKPDGVEFTEMPTLIKVRKELSKTRNDYFTFLGKEGCFVLREYLNERMRSGERFEPDSPVICNDDRVAFNATQNIEERIRKAMRLADYHGAPYSLRDYFAQRVEVAISEVQINPACKRVWMGHKGPMSDIYTFRRGVLEPGLLRSMREAYSKTEPFLYSSRMGPSENQVTEAVAREVCAIIPAVTPEQYVQMDLIQRRAAFEEYIKGLTLAHLKDAKFQAPPNADMRAYARGMTQELEEAMVNQPKCICCQGKGVQTDREGMKRKCPECNGSGVDG